MRFLWPIVALLALLLVGVLPTALAMVDALRDPVQAWAALVDPVLWSRLVTTLGIAGATLALALPLGVMQAWLLMRTDLPLRRLLMMLTPFPLFLPPLVHVLSWFGMVRLGGYTAIVLVYVISFLPFVVLLAARAMRQINREQHEAMRLAGGRRAVVVDEWRQAWPAAMVGGALTLVFVLSDFAVADFLTSVGPSVTVYGDTLYAHHLALRPAGAAAAALPGLVLCVILLVWALRMRRRLGVSVDARFEHAPVMRLGWWRWPALAVAATPVMIGTVLPLVSLAMQTGSWGTLAQQASIASERMWFTLRIGAIAATGMIVLGLPLAALATRMKRRWMIDVLVFIPLAIPPLLYGIGLIRVWNRPGLDAVYVGAGAVIIAMIGRYLAFAYLPLGGAVERMDRSMFESARLAGAGVVARFWHVLLPLLRSPIAAAWCVSFCFTLRELDSLIMLRAGQQSLTFHLYSSVVFARQDEVAAIALLLACITFAPLLIFLMLSNRSLRFV